MVARTDADVRARGLHGPDAQEPRADRGAGSVRGLEAPRKAPGARGLQLLLDMAVDPAVMIVGIGTLLVCATACLLGLCAHHHMRHQGLEDEYVRTRLGCDDLRDLELGVVTEGLRAEVARLGPGVLGYASRALGSAGGGWRAVRTTLAELKEQGGRG